MSPMPSSRTTSARSCWTTIEDVQNDLCAFSEIAVNQDVDYQPPLTTIVQYNAQMRTNHGASIFDTQMPEEDVTYIHSGRGRGGVSRLYRPGMPVTDDGQDFLSRKIREVSGVGYSNEIIEQSIREKIRKVKIPDTDFCDAESDEVYSNERTASPMSIRSTSVQSSHFESASTSPVPAEKHSPQRPPPLSVMLKQAKKNVPVKVQTVPETKKPNGYLAVEPESDSNFRQLSARSSDSNASSEIFYKTAETYKKASSEWNKGNWRSNRREEPLSWRKKPRDTRSYSEQWRQNPMTNDFKINSDEDFPAL